MGLFFERWYPTTVGILVTVAWWAVGHPLLGKEEARDLYATSMSLASITVGFLATAMSIVAASPENSLIRQLKESRYMEDLIRYLREPFSVGLFFAALSLVGFFCNGLSGHAANAFGAIWVASAGSLLASMYRIGMVFVRFLKASAVAKPPAAAT